MKVCESCGGCKTHARTFYGMPVQVVCGTCLGTGLISLGYESQARWRQLREEAIDRGIREGWVEEVWAGEPGQARPTVRPMSEIYSARRAS